MFVSVYSFVLFGLKGKFSTWVFIAKYYILQFASNIIWEKKEHEAGNRILFLKSVNVFLDPLFLQLAALWVRVSLSFKCVILNSISIYKMTKIVRVFWLVKNLWFIVPVNLNDSVYSARDLQAFVVFSQHPAWGITPVNPWKVWSLA